MAPDFQKHLLSCFNNKKIVVTGASGYIGSKLVSAIQDADSLICRMSRDKRTLPIIKESSARIMDYEGSIQERRFWEKVLPESDIVFHLSGQTNLNYAQENVIEDWNANVLPMQQLLECCRQIKLTPSIVFSGTATQVGLTSKLPVNESVTDLPITIYDLHKLNAEDYLKSYSAQAFVNGVSLRLTNVYGPGTASMNKNRGIINQMAVKALIGNNLTVYGEGKYIRDYVFIDDVVSAFLNAIQFMSKLKSRHFLVGSGQGVSISDAISSVAENAQKITGRAVALDYVPEPLLLHPIERRNFIADISAFRENTQWFPATEFENGLGKTVKYTFENMGI
jgi:nucleoside-diphosphate-sugar epimerase